MCSHASVSIWCWIKIVQTVQKFQQLHKKQTNRKAVLGKAFFRDEIFKCGIKMRFPKSAVTLIRPLAAVCLEFLYSVPKC